MAAILLRSILSHVNARRSIPNQVLDFQEMLGKTFYLWHPHQLESLGGDDLLVNTGVGMLSIYSLQLYSYLAYVVTNVY
jgi:hypothetical protein